MTNTAKSNTHGQLFHSKSKFLFILYIYIINMVSSTWNIISCMYRSAHLIFHNWLHYTFKPSFDLQLQPRQIITQMHKSLLTPSLHAFFDSEHGAYIIFHAKLSTAFLLLLPSKEGITFCCMWVCMCRWVYLTPQPSPKKKWLNAGWWLAISTPCEIWERNEGVNTQGTNLSMARHFQRLNAIL